ncbi:hypothetical protein Tco_1041625 [Tanacetum coccineum]|uniref:Uncharacterized protein n=1 Tax=Tanacetum coccineum TaxID=301880 RepID=A0ABQ5GGN5_9ASTR
MRSRLFPTGRPLANLLKLLIFSHAFDHSPFQFMMPDSPMLWLGDFLTFALIKRSATVREASTSADAFHVDDLDTDEDLGSVVWHAALTLTVVSLTSIFVTDSCRCRVFNTLTPPELILRSFPFGPIYLRPEHDLAFIAALDLLCGADVGITNFCRDDGSRATVSPLSIYLSWETKSANDVIPHELLYLVAGDGCDSLCLDPFGEIIDGNN